MKLLALMGSPRKKGDGFKVIEKLKEVMQRRAVLPKEGDYFTAERQVTGVRRVYF